MHIIAMVSFVCKLGKPFNLSKNLFATSCNASLGQLVNQSRVQQFTKLGNLRHLTRSYSPTGLMHKTICRLFLTPSTKKFHNASGESGFLSFRAVDRTPLSIYSTSSFFENRFGTSPVLSMLFTSSRNDSYAI